MVKDDEQEWKGKEARERCIQLCGLCRRKVHSTLRKGYNLSQYEFCVAAPVPAADGTIAASEWELKS
ncbi:hypothetical protein Tco_0536429 [Tanacetum coccineum]